MRLSIVQKPFATHFCDWSQLLQQCSSKRQKHVLRSYCWRRQKDIHFHFLRSDDEQSVRSFQLVRCKQLFLDGWSCHSIHVNCSVNEQEFNILQVHSLRRRNDVLRFRTSFRCLHAWSFLRQTSDRSVQEQVFIQSFIILTALFQLLLHIDWIQLLKTCWKVVEDSWTHKMKRTMTPWRSCDVPDCFGIDQLLLADCSRWWSWSRHTWTVQRRGLLKIVIFVRLDQALCFERCLKAFLMW